MRIAVIDGQGGGIGKVVVERLRREFENEVEIVALGTNSFATLLMIKAGANEGATGENAIVFNANKVDIIIGPIGILCTNAFLGEITEKVAKAVSESSAEKILIPLNRYNISVAGVSIKPLPHYIEDIIITIRDKRGEEDV